MNIHFSVVLFHVHQHSFVVVIIVVFHIRGKYVTSAILILLNQFKFPVYFSGSVMVTVIVRVVKMSQLINVELVIGLVLILCLNVIQVAVLIKILFVMAVILNLKIRRIFSKFQTSLSINVDRDCGSEDNSDEDSNRHNCLDRPCRPGEFRCESGVRSRNTTKCIRMGLACDGYPHCVAAEDETNQNCTKRDCRANEFKCQNGLCINAQYKW